MKSEQINELAKALSLAQGKLSNASKDKSNPFFHSKYATLASTWDACREALSSNGLSVTQIVAIENGLTVLKTILLHSSGQWLESSYPINPVKPDPQGLGSAITYARRYSLQAIVGISAEDDDGNEASQPKIQQTQNKVAPPRSSFPAPDRQQRQAGPQRQFPPPGGDGSGGGGRGGVEGF